MGSLKQQLYLSCLSYAEHHIASIESAIKEIQQSANEETKSSAGDKYETGRAMAQLEIDKHRSQLAESMKMKQELLRISVDDNTPFIKPGSLIFTSRGNFYIAINAGQQEVDNQTFFTVSSASPIAQKLIGLKVGDVFTLNHKEFSLLKIH
jgi:hypothetical protein